MKKLALYARTSTDDQKTGLEAQERALREYLVFKKIPPEEVLEFRDDGITGKKRSRPSFDRMMAAVRAGEVHTVLVYSFSRFARTRKQLHDAADEFKERGVRFVSLTENIDTEGALGVLVFSILAALAQFEVDLISERVRNGLKNARAKGRFGGRPKTIGGKKENPPRPDEKILELAEEGMGARQVAQELGISHGQVYRVLRAAGRLQARPRR